METREHIWVGGEFVASTGTGTIEVAAPFAAPFGGYKQSGLGREGGPAALDEYTEQKYISVDRSGGVENKAYALVLGTPA